MKRKKYRVKRYSILLTLIGIAAGFCACSEETVDDRPPPGWTIDGSKWWRSDVDTTGFFAKMETMDEMGVEVHRIVFGAGKMTVTDQVIAGVQRRLLPLYRNRPLIVDSLFHAHVVPRIKQAKISTDNPSEMMDRQLSDAYRTLARHFREPRALSTVGKDIPFSPRPDSLNHVEGVVRMQIHVGVDGSTESVELLESVHPVLDEMAMAATSRMEWSPAYLHGEAIPSWARFRLRFDAASE